MPWGTSEGGIPQPYRIEVQSSHWEKARNREGELVTNRQGENLMNLVLEGNAFRLVEEDDGSFSLGEAIEPIDGKINRRSMLIGNTSQWTDPREDGKKIESVRGPNEMPWARSEIGRLINSLVELVGTDVLEDWGPWEEAATWNSRTFDLVPVHDLDKEGNPVTFTTGAGEERIDWYFTAVAVSNGAKKSSGKRRGKTSGSLEAAMEKAYKGFKGNEDEFVDFLQTENFDQHESLAKLSDKEFDALVDKTVG